MKSKSITYIDRLTFRLTVVNSFSSNVSLSNTTIQSKQWQNLPKHDRFLEISIGCIKLYILKMIYLVVYVYIFFTFFHLSFTIYII